MQQAFYTLSTPFPSNGQTATTIEEWHNPRPEGNFTRQLYNGLGQLVQTQTPNQNWQAEISVDHTYDALGHSAQTSVPHGITKVLGLPANYYQPPNFSQGVTTNTYDALGRPLRVIAPNGQATAYTYKGRASAQWGIARLGDEYDRVLKRNDLDGLGNVQYIRTYTGTGSSMVEEGVETLTHDILGNLTQVNHAAGAGVTTLSYDLAGRKLAMNDADMGTWTYAYDRQSHLTQQTDACGNLTVLVYEPILQRLSSQQFSKGATCATAALGYTIAYIYGLGLPTQVQSSFNLRPLVDGVTYDEASRVTRLTFPTGGNLARQQTYAPWNQPDNNGGQLQATQIYTGTLTRLQLGYSYDSFGNIKTLTDGGSTNAFTYDDQNRLTNAYARPYAYDSAGRLTDYENTLTAVNNSFPVHALKPTGYSYDANGNMTTRPGGQSLTWDTANRLQSVMGNGVNESYLYDETGQRLQKISNSQVTTDFSADDSLPETVCAGQTGPGANWQVYSSNGTNYGLYLEVDTSRCGFSATPRYFSVLTGNGTALTNGGNSIYLPTATGFRIYVRYTDARAPSIAEAQQGNWRVTWRAAPDQTTPTACTGATPAGATAWQADGHGGLTLAVNTSACGFNTIPIYQTALNGASNHWATSGVNTILTPTPTGFRVQVTYAPGPITPATANQLRWQVNWRATSLRHTYTFAGQHIALRQGKTFTYLHTDHLGSTLLATDQTGAVVGGNQPRYYAYGRERMPSVAALPTDYTFTGQKLDGSGLIYMNARYYDPQLGAFISPDSVVPDPSRLADYNRYLYAQGNPMKYSDPSGHDGWDMLVNTYFAVTDFGFGVGAQVGYNTTSVILPGEYNSLAVQSSESTAKTVGRHVGNVISLAQAAGEMAGGAGMAGGGVAICVTAVGCLATPVVTAAGVAVGVHGVAVGASAMSSEATFLSNVMLSVTEDDSSNGLMTNIPSTGRKFNQLQKRGWTQDEVDNVVNNPFTTRTSINKQTGNSATVYYQENGHYIVRDNITGDLVQMSDTNVPARDWIPDDTIQDPYIPKEK